jgi:hypothetical protein
MKKKPGVAGARPGFSTTMARRGSRGGGVPRHFSKLPGGGLVPVRRPAATLYKERASGPLNLARVWLMALPIAASNYPGKPWKWLVPAGGFEPPTY